MRIKELIRELCRYDDDTEIIVPDCDSFKQFVINKEVVNYRHSNGMVFKDEALVLRAE